MGLIKSFSRRLALVKSESPLQAVRIFFASRDVRRKLEIKKTKQSSARDLKYTNLKGILDKHLDAVWYSKIHQIQKKDAAQHYMSIGLPHSYAPAEVYALPGAPELCWWAVEYFARLGFPLGSNAVGPAPAQNTEGLGLFSIRNLKSKKIAVVTANFGDFDRLLPISPDWHESADFYLLTDHRYRQPNHWRIVRPNFFFTDPRLMARFAKTHLHIFFSDYKWVMWVDANVLICRSPESILDSYRLGDVDFSTFRHWQRNGIISEAAACVKLEKDTSGIIAEHLKANSKHEAFSGDLLFWTMVYFIQPGSSAAREMCNRWWRYIVRGSFRDQLSLPLAIADTKNLKWSAFSESTVEMSVNFVRMKHI